MFNNPITNIYKNTINKRSLGANKTQEKLNKGIVV